MKNVLPQYVEQVEGIMVADASRWREMRAMSGWGDFE